ncbi:uncharacterized protein YbjT (DUF2867 family) [Runella defluvii]|uniref:Uncharacterized protein YbjT (DUF2867 family) n=1 Tax=Runella defluvii TaxID=370973 RepID=A0A7W5ZLT3_9BACT|nr:NAD(P)H-binding protein [Runella defluvii]MBB3838181.1 uncharacterized protein YbjT (DUF2867 family) [Runella defluvii]
MTSEKRTALVVGGSGLVGKEVISELIASEKYTEVVTLTRKPLDFTHPKLLSIIFNFDHPDASVVCGDDIFCCLGTTMKKAGSKEAFYRVDYTYPIEIAQLGHQNGAKRFAIVTAMGADSGSMFYYNRVKGDVEATLKKIGFDALLIFRPSLLVGNRGETRLGEQIGEGLSKILRPLIPIKYRSIEARKVAKAMVTITASNVKGTLVYESDVMQEF